MDRSLKLKLKYILRERERKREYGICIYNVLFGLSCFRILVKVENKKGVLKVYKRSL